MSDKNLRQRIRNGEFVSKLPYPAFRKGDPEVREARLAWQNDSYRLEREVFRDAALSAVGLDRLPKAHLVFDYAWDKGHANGLEEVLSELEELAALLRKLMS